MKYRWEFLSRPADGSDNRDGKQCRILIGGDRWVATVEDSDIAQRIVDLLNASHVQNGG